MPNFKKNPYAKKPSGFKMKGSPMQRNFGIGSPMKYEADSAEFAKRKGEEQGKLKKEITIGVSSLRTGIF